eukprot:TRINITY_DN9656_c1_g1_i1.p1 TRINITY_DN9656_c1_g1~~TRINITY_DN9656_c1_g1_i1.p1  ORF type:complete len:569 (+),score=114.11 TRINITY_DN9656_c1_g1_i1:128-1708(+)
MAEILVATAVVAMLVGNGSFSFIAPSVGPIAAQGPSTYSDWPRRALDEASAGKILAGSSSSATTAFCVAIAIAAAGAALRSKVQRQVIYGGLRDRERTLNYHGKNMKGLKFRYHHITGVKGYRTTGVAQKRTPIPARMSLTYIKNRDAMAKFVVEDFYKVQSESLSFDDVKEVGSYTVKPDSSEIVKNAQLPQYKKPQAGVWLQQEPGDKRMAQDDEGFMEYFAKKSTLLDAAKEVASSSLDSDIIADRSALMILLSFLDDTGRFNAEVTHKGMHKNAVDLIKITKSPNGKGMVMERLFEFKNLWAELRDYAGNWRRTEVSNRGTYAPAWNRLIAGDQQKNWNFMGYSQTAGSKAGKADEMFRFVEYKLGGMSFLTRARVHCQHEGKVIESKPKNWFQQADVKAMSTYQGLLLGKIDMLVLGLHRSGKIHEVAELTVDSIKEKVPDVVEAAEKKLGRLTALLKQVQAAIENKNDGPWVLQWQQGKLILGKYENVVRERPPKENYRKTVEEEFKDAVYVTEVPGMPR